jgi:hypothetical protein
MRVLSFLVWVWLFAFCALCCGDPYEVPLPVEPSDKISFYKAIGGLAADEQKDLQEFFTRSTEEKMKGGPGARAGITVKEALAEQRAWKEAEAIKKQQLRQAAEKAQAEREAQQKVDKAKAQQEMVTTATAELVKLNVVSSTFGKSFDMDIRFKNTGSKELSLIMGTVQLSDKSGAVLKEVKIPYMRSLKPGVSAVSGGKIPFNPDRAGDAEVAKTPLSKLKVTWIPAYYKFADGTYLGEEPKQDRRRR